MCLWNMNPPPPPRGNKYQSGYFLYKDHSQGYKDIDWCQLKGIH